MTLTELKSSGKLVECEQGSEFWMETRKGKVTASMFAAATAKGEGKTKFSYMCKLLSERLTGELTESYTNKVMEWGNDNEAAARSMYAFETGLEITQVGFVKYNDNIGCSPDSLVSDDGLIQIKCPDSHTHIGYLLRKTAPATYMKQIQGEMWVTGRSWSDFVSFDPRNPYKDIFIVRVHRDEEFIRKLAAGVNEFVDELLRQESILKMAA